MAASGGAQSPSDESSKPVLAEHLKVSAPPSMIDGQGSRHLRHLYFESIHPFENGSGRVGRALSEKALSQGLGQPALLSLSREIEARKKEYYDTLKEGQQSNEITAWVSWFINMAIEAQIQAEEQIDFTLKKTRLFDRGMNAKKYMSITGASKATATRDLQDLADKGVFTPSGGGRSTHYTISL